MLRITIIDEETRRIINEFRNVSSLKPALVGGKHHYHLEFVDREEYMKDGENIVKFKSREKYIPMEGNGIAVNGNYCSCFVAETA